MKNLVRSFLTQNFTTTNQLPAEEATSKVSDTNLEPKTPTSTRSYLSTKSPKDLFSFYARKYFHSYNGIRIILNECETNLTYLNVYRKNHLKQLYHHHAFSVNTTTASSDTQSSEQQNSTQPQQHQQTSNKSLSFNLIEEALQAKSNSANLMSDLDFFLKCISLPVFGEHRHESSSSSTSVESNKENLDEEENDDDEVGALEKVFKAQLDKSFVDQISHLVLASQIATLITFSSDLILHHQTSASQSHSTSQDSNSSTNSKFSSHGLQHQLSSDSTKSTDSLCLTKKSVIYFC